MKQKSFTKKGPGRCCYSTGPRATARRKLVQLERKIMAKELAGVLLKNNKQHSG